MQGLLTNPSMVNTVASNEHNSLALMTVLSVNLAPVILKNKNIKKWFSMKRKNKKIHRKKKRNKNSNFSNLLFIYLNKLNKMNAMPIKNTIQNDPQHHKPPQMNGCLFLQRRQLQHNNHKKSNKKTIINVNKIIKI